MRTWCGAVVGMGRSDSTNGFPILVRSIARIRKPSFFPIGKYRSNLNHCHMQDQCKRPYQVKAAVGLFIASIVVGSFRAERSQLSNPVVYLEYLVLLLLIVGIYFGFKTARFIFFILSCLLLWWVVTHVAQIQANGNVYFITLVMQRAMELVACILLFIKPSADWFNGIHQRAPDAVR